MPSVSVIIACKPRSWTELRNRDAHPKVKHTIHDVSPGVIEKGDHVHLELLSLFCARPNGLMEVCVPDIIAIFCNKCMWMFVWRLVIGEMLRMEASIDGMIRSMKPIFCN
jgi:hypothetical protein